MFGKEVAFGVFDQTRTRAVREQTQAIAVSLTKRLDDCLQQALPEAPAKSIKRIIAEVVPKTAAFAPALTVGELEGKLNRHHLTLVAVAVGCMYIADQLIDRGDEKMLYAIEGLPFPASNPRENILVHMREAIGMLALKDDGPLVLECFEQNVLRNEARLHRLSSEYYGLDEQNQQTFLNQHAGELAVLMVEDAGFQSITSSLHAVYRQHDGSLPSIKELHNDPAIARIIQICNAAARIADEYGDWWMDAGNDPRYGVFSINPFNQYHPVMIETFCQLGGIENAEDITGIQAAFKKFHTSKAEQLASGMFITEKFFDQMRQCIMIYRTTHGHNHPFTTYITLCMRVGEISLINMMGDITLADV